MSTLEPNPGLAVYTLMVRKGVHSSQYIIHYEGHYSAQGELLDSSFEEVDEVVVVELMVAFGLD